jgi:hypothetical protein
MAKTGPPTTQYCSSKAIVVLQEVEPGSATGRELTLGSSGDLGEIWAATVLASKEVMRRKDMTRVTEPRPAWQRAGQGRSHRAT